MTQYKSSSDLKDLAKEKLTGKYGIAMLVSPILQGLVSFAFVFPALFLFFFVYTVTLTLETMHDVTTPDSMVLIFLVIYLLILLVCGLLNGVLNAGVVYFNLNLACGRHPRPSDLFCGFRYHFKKALGISAIQILTAMALMIPYFFCLVMWMQNPDVYSWTLGMIPSVLLFIVLWIPIQLSWSQSYYLLSDFPQTKAIDLLKLSSRIMKGHKGRLFYIQLSFIPLQYLCSYSLGIGYLWVTPYQNMTYTLFFLDLMQPAKPKTAEPIIVEEQIVETETLDTELSETENASELY